VAAIALQLVVGLLPPSVGIGACFGKARAVELTTMSIGRRRGLRGWLRGDGPPSARAALFLAFSTFLCGCVFASLLFVGIWRHTADEASRVRAAEAHTRAIQQSDRQRLHAAQAELEALEAQLTQSRQALTQIRSRAAETAAALQHARSAREAIARELTPRLQALADAAAALAGQTATIQSELTALEAYAQHPGATGVDPGYLATQASYVGRSAAAAASAAAALARQARDAQASAGAD
jgi:hypothetical protein